MPEQRIGDAPAFVELADEVLRRHDNVVEEYFTELVIARNRPDRPDRDAGAVKIEQQKADAGMTRLASGSVRTSANIQSECWPQVVQIFCPFTTK